MSKRTGPTNYQLELLIKKLKEKALAEGARLWWRVAEDLEKPTRQRREINLYKLDRFVQDGEIALVPGKVLGVGTVSKPVEVAAFAFSEEAKRKIVGQKGKAFSIEELLTKNPKPSAIRIIG